MTSYMEGLDRNARYTLMCAMRGPDSHMLPGMGDLKAELTGRVRVIAFDLVGKTKLGHLTGGECKLPGDENRETLDQNGVTRITKALDVLDGQGGRHYVAHIVDPFNKIAGFTDHSIWGGYGIRVRNALNMRLGRNWKSVSQAEFNLMKANLQTVRLERESAQGELRKLKAADPIPAWGLSEDDKRAANLLNAIRECMSVGCRSDKRLKV